MTAIESAMRKLREQPRRWLVTGSAGFIGSHLVETLLGLGQSVTSLDNFATGHRANLDEVAANVGAAQWRRHRFVEGDIRDLAACREAARDVDFVLHEAALGSVPRSIADPVATNATNVDGFVNMLVASRDAGVARFIYAASSSTYGDHPGLPKVEDQIGRPLSPYAVTKLVNELYAEVFGRCYGLDTIGLRYFNVFGSRQDPEGAYAAVIPCWVRMLLEGEPPTINGDGETSRDFCHVANAAQANLLAAIAPGEAAVNQIYNVALDQRTTLNELYALLRDALAVHVPEVARLRPVYGEFREGDVRHSQADIGKARRLLGYAPGYTLADGLRVAMPWYVRRFSGTGAGSARAAAGH